MASTTRSFSRLTRSAPLRAAFNPASTFRNTRQPIRHARRTYATQSSTTGSNAVLFSILGAAAAGSAGYFIYTSTSTATKVKDTAKNSQNAIKSSVGRLPGSFTPALTDYQEVYNDIARRLIEFDDYDDGSYGPVVLRLGWHASGTYDAETGTGGSNGATMRFAPESDHGANAGLKAARDFLEPVKAKFPWLSHSDLWTLATVTAIQEMSGPSILWRPGRADRDLSYCTPDGRLPDGAKGASHLRSIFGRMGFTDQEIVALSGAHALGRCHTDRSGFEGPWTFSPITLTNDYFKLLLEEKWDTRKWDGPRQYQDKGSRSLMMLPTDMALVQDRTMRKWVEVYARDGERFFGDFAKVVGKLLELGVPFPEGREKWRLRSLEEQEG